MQAKYFVSEIKYTKKNAKEIGPTKEKVDQETASFNFKDDDDGS